MGTPEGTFYVLEDDPPADRPRWYCHQDGRDSGGFDDVDEAVRWGLEHTAGVVVRTLSGLYFVAGDPADGRFSNARGWPPSPAERSEIDRVYAEAVADAEAEIEARRTYEKARADWMSEHCPAETDVDAIHSVAIVVDKDGTYVDFEELSANGSMCGARVTGNSTQAFGEPEQVLAAVLGRPADDPWIAAVVAALHRERVWDEGRRNTLEVILGRGEMFHASAVDNRESIRRYGLDWDRTAAAPGIAGSRGPELPAIFLCMDDGDVRFFTNMGRTPSDVWAVNVEGLWVESGPSGWWIVPERVGPDRVRLAVADVKSERPPR
jgi:hypothetical protein